MKDLNNKIIEALYESKVSNNANKFNTLKDKIVAENDEWIVYKIDTAEEAYLFHGLTSWPIVFGTKQEVAHNFREYTAGDDGPGEFYFITRKMPIDEDIWNYIAIHHQPLQNTYWDVSSKKYKRLPKQIKQSIPEFKMPKVDVIKLFKTWHLNSDGTYSVKGNIGWWKLKEAGLIKNGKLTINFNYVSGDFDCSMSDLTSLDGCPKEVGGDFDCSLNKLTSLKGCPEKVGGNFRCNGNAYTKCILKSLEGCPKEINGDFSCGGNDLTSLKGAPEKVNGSFYCQENELKSLEGCPKEVGGDFGCWDNSKKFTKDDVKAVCKVGGKIIEK